MSKTETKYGKVNHTVARLLELQEKLDGWDSFVRKARVPAELAPAFMSNRPELLRLARPRVLTADECKTLYDLLGVLLETNAALRLHSSLVADMCREQLNHARAVVSALENIRELANFRPPEGLGGDTD